MKNLFRGSILAVLIVPLLLMSAGCPRSLTTYPTIYYLGTRTFTPTETATDTPTGPWTPIPTATATLSPTLTVSPTLTISPTGTLSPVLTSTATATPSRTPTLTSTVPPATPTRTATRTPTATNTTGIPPTFTATPNGTTIPMGLFVAAVFGSNVTDMGFPMTVVNTLISISVNRNTETTAAVTLTTPNNGAQPCTYIQSANMGTYWVSQYATSFQYTYVPNGVYSVNLVTSLGTAYSSMNAPGLINFNVNGSSVTATYSGNYHSANVTRMSPVATVTYDSGPNNNVGNPFNYPGSAYSSPSLPAQFITTFNAATTITAFSGTAGAFGAFVGTQAHMKMFTR